MITSSRPYELRGGQDHCARDDGPALEGLRCRQRRRAALASLTDGMRRIRFAADVPTAWSPTTSNTCGASPASIIGGRWRLRRQRWPTGPRRQMYQPVRRADPPRLVGRGSGKLAGEKSCCARWRRARSRSGCRPSVWHRRCGSSWRRSSRRVITHVDRCAAAGAGRHLPWRRTRRPAIALTVTTPAPCGCGSSGPGGCGGDGVLATLKLASGYR